LAEQHDEWAEGRRYMNLEVLQHAQQLGTDTTEEVPPQTIEALAA
ncbi:IS256 family transposase, partial [Auritidibacter sp. NML120779]